MQSYMSPGFETNSSCVGFSEKYPCFSLLNVTMRSGLRQLRLRPREPGNRTIYRRIRIGRDGHLNQSEAYDIS